MRSPDHDNKENTQPTGARRGWWCSVRQRRIRERPSQGRRGREWERVKGWAMPLDGVVAMVWTGGVAVHAGKGAMIWRAWGWGMATGIVLALGHSGVVMPMGMEVSTGEVMGKNYGCGEANGIGHTYGSDYGCGSACGDGELEGHGAGYGNGDMSHQRNYGYGGAAGQGGILGMGNG